MAEDIKNDSILHIAGSVGAVAQQGAMQIIDSIIQNIASLQNDTDTIEVSDGLKRLAEAIVGSKEVPSERERKRYLEDIDELTTQAALPKENQEPGVFAPIIDRLANLCSGAGGLAAVWEVVSPAIKGMFS